MNLKVLKSILTENNHLKVKTKKVLNMKSIYVSLVLSVFIGINVSLKAQFSVLLVNDNANGVDRYKEIDTTLNNLGYTYEVYNAVETGTFPDLSIISPYDVVIWYTGNDGVSLKLWDISNPDDYKFNDPIIQYLNNGGIVWLQGLDFFYDIFGTAPDYFVPGQFIYDYMGVSTYFAQSYSDDGNLGLPQLDVVEGNGICSFTPVEWVYTTLWYADALEYTSTAQPIYRMGPQGYFFEDYYSGIYNVNGDSKIFTLTVETARIDTEEHTDSLFSQVLSYFESITGGDILVSDISVSGEWGSTSINVNGGTLQMFAEVLPANATNPTVFWSVINETGIASIDLNGLLQATGTSIGNGTIWVKAQAVDGSGVADSLEITISNQGADFEILLVNDNNFGTDRYLKLDTTLSNLGYAFDIYNTIVTSNFPDAITLSYYDLVIWYTGNDGVDLYLWDVSDTNNYKFNAPLIDYIESGGYVWLQGLDFFFDIFGTAPDYFTEGQFIYDFMGVASYYAQSYVDDGQMGVLQLDVVAGNPICSITPVQWIYTTMWYVDALELSPGAQGIYTLGPAGYVFDSYYAGVYNIHENARIFTLSFETARINTQENTDELFYQVIEYFRLITNIPDNSKNEYINTVTVFPNPAGNKVFFRFFLQNDSNIELTLFTLTGMQVYSGLFYDQAQGEFEQTIIFNELNLSQGIYTYKFKTNQQIYTGKLIVR
jgi:hypothetical protein